MLIIQFHVVKAVELRIASKTSTSITYTARSADMNIFYNKPCGLKARNIFFYFSISQAA